MREIYFILLSSLILNSFGQFTDSFDDQNLDQEPSWEGYLDKFEVDEQNWLHLNAPPQSDVAQLSTYCKAINDATWEFQIKLDFNPSSSNYAKVYLCASNADLNGYQEGYFLKIGGTNDEISLFRQDGFEPTKIIDGTDDLIDQDPVEAKIRVERSAAGIWKLWVSLSNEDFQLEGIAEDTKYNKSYYFGLQCVYTATRSDKFYFDDIEVSGNQTVDLIPASITEILPVSSTGLQLQLTEALDPIDGLQLSNYMVNGGIGHPIQTELDQTGRTLQLHFDNEFSIQSYHLTILAKDKDQNMIDEQVAFNYAPWKEAEFRDIVINEIFFDPAPNPYLPNHEYIELFNTTTNYIDLSSWIVDEGSEKTFPDQAWIGPNEHILICDDNFLEFFKPYGKVYGLSSLSLSNDGETIALKNTDQQMMDWVKYDLNMFETAEKKAGGWSLEQINPFLNCVNAKNWGECNLQIGGSPAQSNGIQNNDFNPIFSLEITEFLIGDQLQIRFNQTLDTAQALLDPVTIINGPSIQAVNFGEFYNELFIELDVPLEQEKEYEIDLSTLKSCLGNSMSSPAFSFNTFLPKIEHVAVKNKYRILLQLSSKPTSHILATPNYFLLNELDYPTHIEFASEDLQTLELTFQNELNEENNLFITSITDEFGNKMSDTTISVQYRQDIQIVEVVDPQILRLRFKAKYNTNSAKFIENYAISELNRYPTWVFIENEYQILLYFDEALPENDWLHLWATGLIKASTNDPLITPEMVFFIDTKPPKLTEIIVMDTHSIQLHFNEPLDSINCLSTSLYQIKPQNIEPNTISLLESDSVLMLHFQDSFDQEHEQILEVQAGLKDAAGNPTTKRQSLPFLLDTTPPKLTKVRVQSDYKIQLNFSEEVHFSEDWTSHLQVPTLTISSINQPKYDSSQVFIHFDQPIGADQHQLAMINLSDQFDHILNDTIYFTNQYPQVANTKLLNPHALVINFSKNLQQNPLDNSLEAVNSENSIIEQSYASSNAIKLLFEQPFEENLSYQIIINPFEDLQGNIGLTDTIEFTYINPIEQLKITNPRSLKVTFDRQIRPDFAEYVQIPAFDIINSVPDSDDLGVQLIVDSTFQVEQVYELKVDSLFSIFDQYFPGSKHQFVYDTLPPTLEHFEVQFKDYFLLKFNESLQENSLFSSFSYALQGDSSIFYPKSIHFDPAFPSVVRLHYPPIANGEYTLTITGVMDEYENPIKKEKYHFEYVTPRELPYQALQISEIMADPSPSVDLPEHEFVEIYNHSDSTINLHYFKLMMGNQHVVLPSFSLSPKEYVTLGPSESDSSKIKPYLMLTDWKSIKNTGDTLALIMPTGKELDWTYFDASWFESDDKIEGGWSLEKASFDNTCITKNTWGFSTNAQGGTPSRPNAFSGKNSESPLSIQFIEIVDSISINIHFSTILTTVHILKAKYNIPGQTIKKIQTDKSLSSYVNLTFDEPLQPQKIYEITIDQLPNCEGNPINLTHSFGIGKMPSWHELIITEIYADPTSNLLFTEEFMEIYNPTEKIISLKNLILIVDDSYYEITSNDISILPKNYCTISAKFIENSGVTMKNWPNLPNETAYLALATPEKEIFVMTYFNEWHDYFKRSGGYSMEMIDTNYPCGENNWGSSIAENGATPARENSIKAEKPDLFGPKIEQVLPIRKDLLLIRLNEPPNIIQLTPSNIQIESLEVKHIFQTPTQTNEFYMELTQELDSLTNYTLTINQLRDCSGNISQNPDNTHSFKWPKIPVNGDLVWNEILYAPNSGGVEFVEIYNATSDPLRLNDLSICTSKLEEMHADPSACEFLFKSPLILEPNEHLAITSDRFILQQHYPKTNLKQTIEVDLPTLPNEGAQLFLKNGNHIIDSVTYHENIHSKFITDTKGISLERISPLNLTTEENWHSASEQAGFATPGYLNSQSLPPFEQIGKVQANPEVFSPESAGISNFTTITYQFDKAGLVGNVAIYDKHGITIRHLAQNAWLGRSGSFKWEGENQTGSRARIGAYLLVFEVFDQEGHYEAIKIPLFIGGPLD